METGEVGTGDVQEELFYCYDSNLTPEQREFLDKKGCVLKAVASVFGALTGTPFQITPELVLRRMQDVEQASNTANLNKLVELAKEDYRRAMKYFREILGDIPLQEGQI